MAYYRKTRATNRRGSRVARSSKRGRGSTSRGSGRGRSRARASPQEIRIVVTTPSDMLPPRPTAGAWARVPRRSRF